MNERFVFEHPEFGQLRVLLKDNGEVHLAAEDICRMLGMTLEKAVAAFEGEDEFKISSVENFGNDFGGKL
jgi:prophage antirepressor-like protein